VEVSPAILLPAGFVVIGAGRPIFAVRYGIDRVAVDSQIDEETLGGGSAAVTEPQVILFAPTFVAVAFDREFDARMTL
jgi:hypothetical protein